MLMKKPVLDCLLISVVLGSIASASPSPQDGGQPSPTKKAISPRVSECALTLEKKTIKPLSTQTPWVDEHLFGDLRISLDGGKINALGLSDRKKIWSTVTPGNLSVRCWSAAASIAYLGGYLQGRWGALELENPPRIRRLNVQTGKWLEDLPIGVVGKADAGTKEIISSVLAGEKGVLVLSLIVQAEGDEKLVGYRVTRFAPGTVKPLWSKRFASVGARPRPGAYLLASAQPNQAAPAIQHLSWVDDTLLVCAGDVQDLLCLDEKTGEKRWWFKKIWTQKRGFIGPSVWQHTLGGARRAGDNQDPRQVAEDRAADAKASDAEVKGGAIIGGPVVVPRDFKNGGKGKTIFVAAARMPDDHFAGYLADALVYEMSLDGALLAMAQLPRLVNGGRFRIQPDGVVWACQENAFVKVACSSLRGFGMGMGPGGPDLVARIDWYRQLDYDEPEAWLSADKSGDPVALGSDWSVRQLAGGHILRRDDGVYHFPLALVDLKTGLHRSMMLDVPFDGTVFLRASNFSFNGKSTHVKGPYLLAITQLRIEKDRLRVTLGMENWSAVVDFSMDEFLRP
jgi:hypothetical protein